MTEADKGIQKALARVGDTVRAIGELSADALLAELNDEQKAELSAKLPAAAAAETMPKKDGNCSEDGDEDDAGGDSDPMEKPKGKAAVEAPKADARVAAVAAAVANDESCKGKADLALQMLADDDYAGLSASGIVKLLGKSSASSAEADPEAAARAEMKAALAETTNSNAAATSGNAPDKAQSAIAPWDKVIAGMNPSKAA